MRVQVSRLISRIISRLISTPLGSLGGPEITNVDPKPQIYKPEGAINHKCGHQATDLQARGGQKSQM